MVDNKKSLKVNIYGTEYSLVVDSDTRRIQEIANYVDNKMKEIQSARPSRPVHQIAILAALNITEELFKVYDEKGIPVEADTDFENQIEALTDKLKLGIEKISEDSENF